MVPGISPWLMAFFGLVNTDFCSAVECVTAEGDEHPDKGGPSFTGGFS